MHFNRLISLDYMLSYKKAPQHSRVLIAWTRVWYKETAPPNLINLKLIIAKSDSCIISLNEICRVERNIPSEFDEPTPHNS